MGSVSISTRVESSKASIPSYPHSPSLSLTSRKANCVCACQTFLSESCQEGLGARNGSGRMEVLFLLSITPHFPAWQPDGPAPLTSAQSQGGQERTAVNSGQVLHPAKVRSDPLKHKPPPPPQVPQHWEGGGLHLISSSKHFQGILR